MKSVAAAPRPDAVRAGAPLLPTFGTQLRSLVWKEALVEARGRETVLAGGVFALLVLTVAAAEAAIGLAILVVYFRNRGSIAVEDVNLMKG